MIQQIQALYEALGQEISCGEYDWQMQKRSTTWVSTADVDQGSLTSRTGSDFLSIGNKTFWNFTLRRPVFGPISDVDWQMLQAFVPGGPLYQYRIAGDRILLNPTPVAGETYGFIWKSRNWILAVDGVTYKETFTADTDVSLLPENVMKVGVQAWWARQKGLPYADLLASFDGMVETAKMKDGTKQILSMDRPSNRVIPGIWVPAGNWPIS
jgi:hypothetical protein